MGDCVKSFAKIKVNDICCSPLLRRLSYLVIKSSHIGQAEYVLCKPLLPVPSHLLVFQTPGHGIQEDLLNPPTDWGQAGLSVVPWISVLEDGHNICLFSATQHFPQSPPPLHNTHTPVMIRIAYHYYNYRAPLTSHDISKLLLIILLPLAFYHVLPCQNNTWRCVLLKYLGSGSASSMALWLYCHLIQWYSRLIKSLQWREYPRHIVLMC